MRTLNRDAAEALRLFEPHAVTDVTGFGLFGHAYEVAVSSGVRLRLSASDLPALAGARAVAQAGERTGGDRRNREYVAAAIDLDGVPDDLVALGFDPQTAGGMLVSLPRDRAVTAQAALAARGVSADRIGMVEEGSGIVVTSTAPAGA
jgi:selenide,water dikinase